MLKFGKMNMNSLFHIIENYIKKIILAGSVGGVVVVVSMVALLVVLILFLWKKWNSIEGMEVSVGFPKKGYVINLEKNKDRYSTFMSKYNKSDFYGNISIEKFNAINGKEINVEPYLSKDALVELKEVENMNYRTKHYQLTRGAIGCFLSHVAIMRKLIDDVENDAYIVFEDDVDFYTNAKYLMEKGMEKAPKNWHFLGFGYIRLVEKEDMGSYVLPNAFWGMQCYIVNKEGAKLILDEIEKTKIDGQIDSYLSVMVQQGKLNLYVYKQKLISTNSSTTDIQMQIKHFVDINPFLYKGYIV